MLRPAPPAPPAATVLATLHVSLLNPHRDPEARCFSNQFILQLRLSHLHKTQLEVVELDLEAKKSDPTAHTFIF